MCIRCFVIRDVGASWESIIFGRLGGMYAWFVMLASVVFPSPVTVTPEVDVFFR